LNAILSSGKPDFPFMICWANEPWTRNWDGLERDVLLPQCYAPGWEVRFARDVAPVLKDRRYFRLNGRPMLAIYRVGQIPEAALAVRTLRAALAGHGVPEVHVTAAWVQFGDDEELPPDPRALGLDAYFEFPPHRVSTSPPPGLRETPDTLGGLYDYSYTVEASLAKLQEPIEGPRHRAVMAGWDNTPRRQTRAHVFHGATPANFRRWLRKTVLHEAGQPGERVIFINAWNEWAEGTYLEPDQTFGKGWLEAVASAAKLPTCADSHNN